MTGEVGRGILRPVPVDFMRRWTALVALLLVGVGLGAHAAQLPTVVVTGDPVAPSPAQSGTGLCTASRVSTDPSKDFQQSSSGFIFGVNTFLDAPPDASNPNARVTSVLRTLLDLSNNNTAGQDRKSTRLNSSHSGESRMPSSA